MLERAVEDGLNVCIGITLLDGDNSRCWGRYVVVWHAVMSQIGGMCTNLLVPSMVGYRVLSTLMPDTNWRDVVGQRACQVMDEIQILSTQSVQYIE